MASCQVARAGTPVLALSWAPTYTLNEQEGVIVGRTSRGYEVFFYGTSSTYQTNKMED